MPRRIFEYQADAGWHVYNLISTIGAFIIALGVLITIINVVRSLKHGAIAGPGPVEGEHARVVHALAAAGAQLRRRPARALGRADEGLPAPGRGADGLRAALRGRPADGARLRLIAWRPRASARPPPRPPSRRAACARSSRDYVTLTKPKVQSLLLLTTVTTMYVAGDPSLALVFWTVPRRLARLGRRRRGQPLVRPRHRRADGAHGHAAGARRADLAARGADLRDRARGALVRRSCR